MRSVQLANTTIIQGVKIGMNCIFGAGSIAFGNVFENNMGIDIQNSFIGNLDRRCFIC